MLISVARLLAFHIRKNKSYDTFKAQEDILRMKGRFDAILRERKPSESVYIGKTIRRVIDAMFDIALKKSIKKYNKNQIWLAKELLRRARKEHESYLGQKKMKYLRTVQLSSDEYERFKKIFPDSFKWRAV